MDRSKKYMYIGVIILLITLVSSIGTYAYFTWTSTDNTTVTLSIGDLADVTYTTGPDININNLSPVYNYTDGESTTFSIRNKDASTSLIYKIKLDITTIDTELQSTSLKYILQKDNTTISEGNFEEITSGSSILLYKDNLDSSTTSTYKLYIYIDGNIENNTNMMNKSLIGKIDVEVEEDIPIPLADYITNLYTNTAKTTVTNNSITYNYATSVNLMNDRLGGTTTSLDEGNIRYYGASPNNYIYFNCSDYSNQTSDTCELWRIIGVFDGKVKIMRNESIGSYDWDHSEKNDWATADLMKLLNPGYESESIEGSLYYNSGSGTCYSDSNSYYSDTTSCDFTSSGIKNDITRGMIAKVTWNLGGTNSSSIYSNQIYGYERGASIASGNNTTWTGKIALPYPSDYGYAADFNSCSKTLIEYNDSTCTSNDWIYSIITNSGNSLGWLLTHNYDYSDIAEGWMAFFVYAGLINDNSGVTSRYMLVLPTLFLNSTETLYKDNSDGSSTNPYKLNP